MAMPLLCRGARPFIVYPIAYPSDYIAEIAVDSESKPAIVEPPKHAVQLALEWRQMLNSDDTLTLAKIARNQGLSRARVTQIMNLLKLPKEIINHIRNMTTPEEFRRFSERRLRQLLSLKPSSAQVQEFNKLRMEIHG